MEESTLYQILYFLILKYLRFVIKLKLNFTNSKLEMHKSSETSSFSLNSKARKSNRNEKHLNNNFTKTTSFSSLIFIHSLVINSFERSVVEFCALFGSKVFGLSFAFLQRNNFSMARSFNQRHGNSQANFFTPATLLI